MLYVRSKSGKLVRLDTLVDVTEGTGPMTVNHSGQLPSVTISFDLSPGVALDQAMAEVQKTAQQKLPDTVNADFEGTASSFKSSMGTAGFLLIIAIVVIYIILGCLYESFIHPLTILSGLPSAAMGGLLSLIVFRQELHLYGFVGIIMLIGIVKKNAIMVVDFAIEAEKHGMTPAEAAFEGCIVRFRPIMMTTMAAIMGALPIALGFGVGAEARRPLGLVVVGGLVLSQVVTLYLTPVYYTYMDDFQDFMRHRGVVGLYHHLRNSARLHRLVELACMALGWLDRQLMRVPLFRRLADRLPGLREAMLLRAARTRQAMRERLHKMRPSTIADQSNMAQELRDVVMRGRKAETVDAAGKRPPQERPPQDINDAE